MFGILTHLKTELEVFICCFRQYCLHLCEKMCKNQIKLTRAYAVIFKILVSPKIFFSRPYHRAANRVPAGKISVNSFISQQDVGIVSGLTIGF